jgi:hypothetical protein
VPHLTDFSLRETTKDQARIEAVLEGMDLADRNMLHVGVGNSGLAQRLASRLHLIDGLTVSSNEKARADALAIPNYRVFLLNKHSHEFVLPTRYDVIVDNNLASFACCKHHFHLMLTNYLTVLRPRGGILTDRKGMDWVFADPRWRLTYEDLMALEAKFPVRAHRLTRHVYALEKTARPRGPRV